LTQEPPNPDERYFHEREARLRHTIREEMERRVRRRGRPGADARLLDRIHALGLDGDVSHVMHLLPLVGIAWAGGKVTRETRAAVMAAVEAHGVESGSEAAMFMASLLEQRPSDALLDAILSALKELLATRKPRPRSLLDACDSLARTSGTLLGFGNPVSDQERHAIAAAAEFLETAAVRQVTRRLT